MNALIIRLVADALTGTKKLIKPEKNLEARKIIQDVLDDYVFLAWGIGDIKDSLHAKKAKPKLTNDECREILATIYHRYDASIGVNHDTINEHVYQFLATRQMNKEKPHA